MKLRRLLFLVLTAIVLMLLELLWYAKPDVPFDLPFLNGGGERAGAVPRAETTPVPASAGSLTPEQYRLGVLPKDFPNELIPRAYTLHNVSARVARYPDGTREESVSFIADASPADLLSAYKEVLGQYRWRTGTFNATLHTMTAQKFGEEAHIIVSSFGASSQVNVVRFLPKPIVSE